VVPLLSVVLADTRDLPDGRSQAGDRHQRSTTSGTTSSHGVAAVCIRPQSRPAGDAGELAEPVLRVAFANLLYRNRDVRGILSELATGEHDIVGLAEATEAHATAIDALLSSATYPWRW
jgi:hypothetical protein